MGVIFKGNNNLISKWLSIGFSKDHDAVFMNNIAKTGNELGNFIFVDTGKNVNIDPFG